MVGEQLLSRPTLCKWVEAYGDIRDDYIRALGGLGVEFARPGEHAGATDRVLARLRDKGARLRNGGASVVFGELSSACVACTGDMGSRTFTLSTACNRNCYFCFNANQRDYDETRVFNERWREELDDFLGSRRVTHVALTGGEPLLHSDDAAEFFRIVRAAYPDAHTRLYTAGDFLDEAVMENLRLAGLTELRLSVKIDSTDSADEVMAVIDDALRKVRLAKSYVRDVMVEMPAIPGTEDGMRRLLLGLDEAGAFGINLLEFGFPMGDWSEFSRRGFQIANPPFEIPYEYDYAAGLPIAGSWLLCLELLEYAIDEGLSLGVHCCSLENKHRDQVITQNRQLVLDSGVWEVSEDDYFYKALKVFDGDIPLTRAALDDLDLPYEDSGDELAFAVRHLEAVRNLPVALALSTDIVEERTGGYVVRELDLKIVEGVGIMSENKCEVGGNWHARAAMCELMALSLRYPNAELACAAASGEWADAAEEIAGALGLGLPDSFAADARANLGEDPSQLLHSLRAEATHLFIGAPDPAVSPFEGVWRAGDDGVQALLFVNPHSMDVERFCRNCGLGRPEGTNEPLDHVSTELELLQYLASVEAGVLLPAAEAPQIEELPGGSAGAAYYEFLSEHVLSWMPRFARETADKTRMPFLRAASQLLSAFLEAENALAAPLGA